MNIEKLIKENRIEAAFDESEVQAVVEQSKRIFETRESEHILSYYEFLCDQFRLIRKRWWGLQVVLLCIAWRLLATGDEMLYIRREIGILSTLFVILMIPELWRNLTNRCTEIESAAYFSLQKIYAARITILGLMDVLMLSVFGGCAHYISGIPVGNIIIDLLLPITVTACICFAVLGRQNRSAGFAVIFCVIGNAVWWGISANDTIYSSVAFPVWIIVFVIAILFLMFMVNRLLKNCNKYMEVLWSSL